MKKERVQIVYGLIGDGRWPSEATQKRLFPYPSKPLLAGGCCSGPDSPKYGLAYACPQCTAAELAWYRPSGRSR